MRIHNTIICFLLFLFSIVDLTAKEKLFWEGKNLTCRALEDDHGQAMSCQTYRYNQAGKVIQETLFGNLTGACSVPLVLGADGQPESNGVESYSIYYEYDAKDPTLLVRQYEDNGASTLFSYDPTTKRCLSKRSPLTRQFFHYDDTGFLTRQVTDDGQGESEADLTGVASRKIIISAPSNGQPLFTETRALDIDTQQELLLERVSNTYSPKGLLLQQEVFDANGVLHHAVMMRYDAAGCLLEEIDSRGAKPEEESKELTHSRYNAKGQRTAQIDHYGNETSYVYDDGGRLIQTIFPSVLNEQDEEIRPVLSVGYDHHNQVIWTKDALGNELHRRHNARGQPIEALYPDGTRETWSYNLDGTVRECTAKNGQRTLYETDCFGRLLSSKQLSAAGASLNTLFYTYQGEKKATVSDDKSYSLRFQYDGAGRQVLTELTTKDGVQRLEQHYDAAGQPAKIKQWFGPNPDDYIVQVTERDAWGKVIETRLETSTGKVQKRLVAEASKEPAIISHENPFMNARGQYVDQIEKVDAQGRRELLTYDAMGRLESTQLFNSLNVKLKETQFRYNANGKKVLERHLVLSKGDVIRTSTICWEYDAAGRIIALTEGASSAEQKRTTHHYNTLGQLESVVKPDGTVLSHLYDEAGRVSHFKASDGSFSYAYSYDEQGRLIAVEDLLLQTTITRAYNDLNQLIEEQLSPTLAIRNNYDLMGNRLSMQLPDNSAVAFEYEGTQMRAVSRHSPDAALLYRHGYLHSEDGKLASSVLIQDLRQIDYRYDAEGRILAIQSPWWSETLPAGSFDRGQRLTTLSIQDPTGTYTERFAYADDDQLIQEEGHFAHTYDHDSLYNRLAQDGQPWTVGHFNELSATATASYRYDLNGNRVEKRTDEELTRYEYDALNRLTRVIKNDSSAVGYTYDAFHRRLTKVNYQWEAQSSSWQQQKTVRFLYDGDTEIGSVDEEGEITELRILGSGKGGELGAAIAIELQGHIYAPIHDHQGTVRCLLDIATGSVAEFSRTSAYGEEQLYDGAGTALETSEIGNPWRFSSKRVDDETGFVFFGKRAYDPEVGRWLTNDPLSFYDTPNLYAFVKNNPLAYYDLHGLSWESFWESIGNAFKSAFDFVAGVCVQAVDGFIGLFNPSTETKENLSSIGKAIFGEQLFIMLGLQPQETGIGVYGNGEFSSKVRVSFINGICNIADDLKEKIQMISDTHGGVNVHYVFRPTRGWTLDLCRAVVVKLGYDFGYRSEHAQLLACIWKELIVEMGGVEGGGVIVHYAHSLGGCETDVARSFMTQEELRMIRVATFGSATLVEQGSFQAMTNYISNCDGVPFLDPIGCLQWALKPHDNVVVLDSYYGVPFIDHSLTWPTYRTVIEKLGQQFVERYR